ncbi:MAG TPA: sigma-54 dependent transcriptional regulator [Myxococcaceae bacterium]|nr:sigma-54 dependent transcriptional regulator [Myxococcaceae bacterium]
MSRILICDDEPKLGKLVAEALSIDGHEVVHVGGGKAALKALSAHAFDLVITDLKMPEVDGMEVLRAAQHASNPAEVILMTAYGSTESAVEAMKAGAADYLTKPFAMDELRLRARRLSDQRRAERAAEGLLSQVTPHLVACSPRMKKVLAAAIQVASTDATVLLLGESGTGKNQLARFIHYRSRRAQEGWVEVHCAALPETLLESELFGHQKGAFTGAEVSRRGHLGAAHRGTLFLDEVGELRPATQVKLLRFLQDRQFVPIGSTQSVKVDVRVIAATNRDLPRAVKEGTFREDFFYRLNVFSIEVPALRERPEDILPLAEHFLATRGIPPSKLSAATRQVLVSHRWPGNARELENALERATILAGEGEILPEHLPGEGPTSGRGARDVLRDGFNLDVFERELIYAALERSGGNKAAAARLLGITRRRLYSRMQSLEEKAAEDAPARSDSTQD